VICAIYPVRHYFSNIITENNELSAVSVTDADTGNFFSTDIDAGVSELCWVDVEVTCDVCSAARISHAESRWNVGGENIAGVDEVAITFTKAPTALSYHARTAVPRYT